MSRILVSGLCPLPFENTRMSYGPGIRTWQFAHGLRQAGHEVWVLAMRIPGVYPETQSDPGDWAEEEGVRVRRLDQDRFMDPAGFRALYEEVDPEVVVGATVYGSYPLADLSPPVPFWADQFGHFMAEAQAKAHLDSDDAVVERFWHLASTVSRSADRFSVVSTPQKWALVGELGALGRLSHRTCGEELVEVIPCAVIPSQPVDPDPPLVRGVSAPEDAFLVLWSGGYNVWSDVDTLFEGLTRAMDADPRIHFVSTGGAIEGHDTTTYDRFESLVTRSGHRGRFHLEGWVDADLVPRYTGEADLGVLTELAMYEGQLGSKNRVLQWMGNGLPVLYNQVGELGEILERERVGLVFERGRSDQLAERILWAADHREEVADLTERARALARESFSFAATTRPLVEWAQAACRAGDDPRASARAEPVADRASAGPPEEAESESPGLRSRLAALLGR